jgi:hypothetical protein
VSKMEAVKVMYKVWMHSTSLGKINTESEGVVVLLSEDEKRVTST